MYKTMTEFKRLQIDYSHYKDTDRTFLEGIDPTPKDGTLSAEDLTKLNTAQLDKVYQIFRSYRRGSKGASVVQTQDQRIFDFVKKAIKTPATYVKQAARKNQFLVFGETHSSPQKTRRFMASIIKALKEEGFSHLAIEVDYQDQPDIDEYMRTGKKEALAKFEWMNDAFIEILDAARLHGLRVVCIDDSRYHGEGKSRWEVDEPMFDHLKTQVLDGNPRTKIAVYIGNRHIDETDYLSFVKNGRILEVGTEIGRLGYLLEKYAPQRSCSISIIDPNSNVWGQTLVKQIGRPFALSLDSPIMHTLVRESDESTTLGGAYDAIIGL